MTNIIEVMKNKNNIIPMVGVTIGTVTTVIAVAAMFSPTLFDLLSVGAITGMGFSPALLGIIAALSLAFVFTSVQQMITNTAIENARGKDGLSASHIVAQYMLNNHDTLIGTVVEDENELQLHLSAADYETLTEGKVDDEEVSLFVSLCNPMTQDIKEVQVTFTRGALPDGSAQDQPISVVLTSVDGESDHEKMKAELGLIENSNKGVVVCKQPLKSLDIVNSAIIEPAIHKLVQHVSQAPQ